MQEGRMIPGDVRFFALVSAVVWFVAAVIVVLSPLAFTDERIQYNLALACGVFGGYSAVNWLWGNYRFGMPYLVLMTLAPLLVATPFVIAGLPPIIPINPIDGYVILALLSLVGAGFLGNRYLGHTERQ